MLHVLKTGSVCSVMGFGARASGGAVTLGSTSRPTSMNRAICLLPCSARGTTAYRAKAIAGMSAVNSGTCCCALTVAAGRGAMDYPVVGTGKRMLNLVRGGTSSRTGRDCTVKTACNTSLDVATLSLGSVSLGGVNVGGKLPRARSRTLICLFVTSSRRGRSRCVAALGSFLRRCPGDTSKCVHHTAACVKFGSSRRGTLTSTSLGGTLRIATGGDRARCGVTGLVCSCAVSLNSGGPCNS